MSSADRVENEKESFLSKIDNDLFDRHFLHNLASLTFTAALGYAESWVAPLTFPKVCENIGETSSKKRLSLYEVAHNAVEGGVYVTAILGHANGIAGAPEDWKSYIPVATNIIGRGIGYLYNNYSFAKVTKTF